jgi:hypothetical protein
MASCRQESLPDKTRIYFPVALASLPNLEELTLWSVGRIEMPKASYGFNELRKLTISRYPNSAMYSICPAETGQASSRGGQNIDAAVGYPKLEKITLESSFLDSTLPVPKYSDTERDKGLGDNDRLILGIRSFVRFADTAWKSGEVPSLDRIYMTEPQIEDEWGKLITVWKRPSSEDESGNRIPKNDARWMLGKEQEKKGLSPQ